MQTTLLRPLGFGELLDGAFTIYRRHFFALFATGLLVFVPLSFASFFILRQIVTISDDADIATILLSVFLLFPIATLGYVLLLGALTRLTGCAVRGEPVSIGDGYALAGRRLLALVCAGLLVALISLVAFLILGVIAGIGMALVFVVTALFAGATGEPAVPTAVALIGTIVLMVGIIASLLAIIAIFFAVLPAIMLEGSGPIVALSRSWHLSRGARLRIAGVLFVVFVIVTLPSLGLALAFGVATGTFAADPTTGDVTVQLMAQQLIGLITNALTYPFIIGCLTLLYFDRRVRTEAYDLEAAAEALPANL